MSDGSGTITVFFLLNTAAYILIAFNLFDSDYKISNDYTTKIIYMNQNAIYKQTLAKKKK